MEQNPDTLIAKFLRKELSQEEVKDLKDWMELPENRSFLEEEIQIYHLINAHCMSFDTDKAYDDLMAKRELNTKTTVLPMGRPWFRYAAAAIFVGLIALAYFFRNDVVNTQRPPSTPIIVNNEIEAGTDKATLTLDSGEEVVLEKGQNYQNQHLVSNGEEIVYQAAEQDKERIVYNSLTIPRGGQFNLKLADGTRVWLNSETRLKYPTSFPEGESRVVELVYGEAYFDVSPSTEHQGADFKVYHGQQEVEVLGTEFNIKAYKDETIVYTTLAEGKVAVDYNGGATFLNPGEQTKLDLNSNRITVVNVNVSRETAWKEGLFSFRHMPLKDIMRVLSRWYDFEVVYEDEKLEEKRFMGTLDRFQSIEEILSALQGTNAIQSYEINQKTLLLK
ncbi:FecR domain-containing protein [Muricauda sp. ANG21]|uniref:FecR family protein n=1 Tax=Allomuricauda sp. ANG21 TaxID=3042468 RepID=UPI0034557B00